MIKRRDYGGMRGREREITVGGIRRKGCRMLRIDRFIKAERNTGSV